MWKCSTNPQQLRRCHCRCSAVVFSKSRWGPSPIPGSLSTAKPWSPSPGCGSHSLSPWLKSNLKVQKCTEWYRYAIGSNMVHGQTISGIQRSARALGILQSWSKQTVNIPIITRIHSTRFCLPGFIRQNFGRTVAYGGHSGIRRCKMQLCNSFSSSIPTCSKIQRQYQVVRASQSKNKRRLGLGLQERIKCGWKALFLARTILHHSTATACR